MLIPLKNKFFDSKAISYLYSVKITPLPLQTLDIMLFPFNFVIVISKIVISNLYKCEGKGLYECWIY